MNATGKTLEECRRNLEEVIDEWIIIRLRNGLPLPQIGDYVIKEPADIAVV
jgi:predicted RNase H-like HicB family nuclease